MTTGVCAPAKKGNPAQGAALTGLDRSAGQITAGMIAAERYVNAGMRRAFPAQENGPRHGNIRGPSTDEFAEGVDPCVSPTMSRGARFRVCTDFLLV
jgi:hypothetical protein